MWRLTGFESMTHDGSKSAQTAVAENLTWKWLLRSHGGKRAGDRGGVGGGYRLYWGAQHALRQLRGWWTKGGLLALVQAICIFPGGVGIIKQCEATPGKS